MTHFGVAVITNQKDHKDWKSVYSEAEQLLAPYQETDEWGAEGSRWDWWMPGGRWDGIIKGLPELKLTEKCDLCHGTGTRPGGREQFGEEWHKATNGCNGCGGSGRSPVWPTHEAYQSPERNLVHVKDIPESAHEHFHAIVTPDGAWHERSRLGLFGVNLPQDDLPQTDISQDPRGFDAAWRGLKRKYPDHVAVGVDCHV
jgi:hypothetical protein